MTTAQPYHPDPQTRARILTAISARADQIMWLDQTPEQLATTPPVQQYAASVQEAADYQPDQLLTQLEALTAMALRWMERLHAHPELQAAAVLCDAQNQPQGSVEALRCVYPRHLDAHHCAADGTEWASS